MDIGYVELGILPPGVLECAWWAPCSNTGDVGAIVCCELAVMSGFGYLLLWKTTPLQVVGKCLPEEWQWDGVALRPRVHLQDQTVDAQSAGELDVNRYQGLISRWLLGWHLDVTEGQHIKVWVIVCLAGLNVVDLFGSLPAVIASYVLPSLNA